MSSKQLKRERIECEKEEKSTLAKQTPDYISEKIAIKIRELNPNLSPLELSELYIKKENIQSSEEFMEEHKLENLDQFVKFYMKDLIPSIKEHKKLRNRIKKMETKLKWDKKSGKFKPGNEHMYEVKMPERKFLMIFSPSALRACDTHRATRELEGGSLKLIHKNRVEQDIKLLKTTWSRILCGTPGRLDLLLRVPQDSIKAEEVHTVVIDMFMDDKLRNLFDYEETYSILNTLLKANPELNIFLY